MSKVFQLDVNALLDPGTTFYFVMSCVALGFDILLDVLLDPFSVSTCVGESNFVKRV